MRNNSLYLALFTLVLILIGSPMLYAQDDGVAAAAQTYLESRTATINKYLSKSDRIQQRLLRRLKKQEQKMLVRLAAKDSTLYKQYRDQYPGYDSLSKLATDSTFLAKAGKKQHAAVDSLKKIKGFMEAKAGKLSAFNNKALPTSDYNTQLQSVQQKLNVQQQVKDLATRQTAALERLAKANNLPGLQGLQKNVYYAQEKIKAWKELADEPDEAEELALEYLVGTEGFSEYMNRNNSAYGGLGNNATAADLERMGYQTKQQVADILQQKLGDNLGAVQQQMAGQIQQYSEKLGGGITSKVKEAKEGLKEAKQTLAEAKATKEGLKNIEKLSFKKNPERGKPFWQRLETQYNFQTTRATIDGSRPAMLELGASLAFKHTPKLSYGLGIGLSTGLGQNWQHIKLSYEGISARAYADWLWQYGISVQAGYERIFRPVNRAYLSEQSLSALSKKDENVFHQAFAGQQQAAYIGLMKRYKINSRIHGTFLLGYNYLWQENGLKSPFILRMGWEKQ